MRLGLSRHRNTLVDRCNQLDQEAALLAGRIAALKAAGLPSQLPPHGGGGALEIIANFPGPLTAEDAAAMQKIAKDALEAP